MTGRLHKKVLVVGTTSNYIDWISNACPDRALFVTHPDIRCSAEEIPPLPRQECVVRLHDVQTVKEAIDRHLAEHGQTLSGIACFDCERMVLAADLARVYGLEYPTRQTIENARDKYLSKKIWITQGVSCPKTALVNSQEDAKKFLSATGSSIVLKPITGSGSELVFKCRSAQECDTAFGLIEDELGKRADNPLFAKSRSDILLAEEMIQGPEYSCDFIVEKNRVSIVRLARKIKPRYMPFGTIAGYMVVSEPKAFLDINVLSRMLLGGALALGIRHGLCMADFIQHHRRGSVLIEMTPRPGGDCLPYLLKRAGNLDILSLALDVAEGKTRPLNGGYRFRPMVGMKILAGRAGIVKGIDVSPLRSDLRIREIHIARKPGHVVTMPPQDYDSLNLGHIILLPDNREFPETLSQLIACRVNVEMEA